MTKKLAFFVCIFLVIPLVGAAGDNLQSVQLPLPQIDGENPLMQVLQKRASSRDFSQEPLPPQLLSNLLWAAYGINRPEIGKRTAPSALNW
ncbi:MAG: nitroreductase family protein, partial [Desulfatirhabdiaceae bacterium]|nr:nitroreductase family protein [Desulfatirhabdiaceae bacterium]